MSIRIVAAAVVSLGGVLLVVACSGASGPVVSASSSATAVHYFEGTPEEFATLERACLADAGFPTSDIGESDGYAVDTTVENSPEFKAAVSKCGQQIGEVKVQGLSTAELQSRYDARVAQFACLVQNGLVTGDPISFEVFVEQYNRSGQKDLWEPTDGASGLPGKGATQVCPRYTSW